MKIACIIPSRIGSTRLPRKPLVPIQGKPMIQWTYENACRCPVFSEVIVATDSSDIAKIIRDCGGKAEITDPDLATGSDRVAAVAAHYPEMDIIVNLQGDEPFIKPKMLEQLVAPYLSGQLPEMTTLAYPLDNIAEYDNPGIVKVITDINHHALYFSRASIPYFRERHPVPAYHHMGVYGFRRDFLMHYQTLPQTPLEKSESIEALRALEHGYRIKVCLTQDKTLEINTPEELETAQQFNYVE